MESAWADYKKPGNMVDFGYTLELMPDTEYMINAISFFGKDMKYIEKKYNFWPMYPTQFWQSSLKFESISHPWYI